jgi:hypothetical protein
MNMFSRNNTKSSASELPSICAASSTGSAASNGAHNFRWARFCFEWATFVYLMPTIGLLTARWRFTCDPDAIGLASYRGVPSGEDSGISFSLQRKELNLEWQLAGVPKILAQIAPLRLAISRISR